MERMQSRVNDILKQLGRTNPEAPGYLLELIDRYLATGEAPAITSGPVSVYHIIFYTLKDEIDAAVSRSQRARERAAKRKAARAATAVPAPAEVLEILRAETPASAPGSIAHSPQHRDNPTPKWRHNGHQLYGIPDSGRR